MASLAKAFLYNQDEIPDHIYNWMAAYFHQRGHVTKIHDVILVIAMITASIIQGSVVGPPSYVVAASGLYPIQAENSRPENLSFIEKDRVLTRWVILSCRGQLGRAP